MPQETLKEAYVLRNSSDSKQTLGVFVTTHGKEMWTCKTLELPDINNAAQKSCIPCGRYLVKKTYSPKFNDNRYEVTGVPNRSGIRFDKANFASQLLGCICLGSDTKDINVDGNLDVIHSGDTVDKFNEIMGGKDFYLNVVEIAEVQILAS